MHVCMYVYSMYVCVHVCMCTSTIYVCVHVIRYMQAPVMKNGCADYREIKSIINQSINHNGSSTVLLKSRHPILVNPLTVTWHRNITLELHYKLHIVLFMTRCATEINMPIEVPFLG